MKNLYIILILVVGALVSSCAKEPQHGGGEELAPGTIAVQFVMNNGQQNAGAQNAKSITRTTEGTPEENRLSNMQLVFWDTDNNTVERYVSFNIADPNLGSGAAWDEATNTLTIKNLTANKLVVYAMANGRGDELSGPFSSNAADLLSRMASQEGAIIDPVTNALPMSGISSVTTVSADNSAKIAISLQRMMAKVNVKVVLGKAFTDAFPSVAFGIGATGFATAMKLINTPHLAYIYPQTPAEMPSNAIASTDVSDLTVAESGDAAAMTWTTTAYTIENLNTDASAMKISLNLPYKDGAAAIKNNYYELEVNHTAAANRVERNKIYNVTITVNGFGIQHLTVVTSVLDWNVQNLETDVQGEAIKPNLTTVELLDENLNTELIVAYTGTAPLTITPDDPAKFTSITRDNVTGVVTIKAKHDGSTTANPDFATLTISNGDTRLDRTVKVKYTPITVTAPTALQNISDTAPNRTVMNVSVSHFSEVTYAASNTITATFDNTAKTLAVHLEALNTNNSIKVPQKYTVTFTANNGRVVGTVNFRYEPLCWAPGDIALSADNKYIIGGVTSDKTLIFQGGSKYGIVGVETTSWVAPATKSYYAPTSVGGAASVAGAVTYANFSIISHTAGQGLGDPCTYIGGDKWRSPVSSELSLLLPSREPADPINGNVALKSGIRGWQIAVYDLFFPWEYATGKSMSQITHDAANVTHLIGYRWSKTPGKTSGEALPAYFAIICDNYNNLANIPRFNWDNQNLTIPVRCVRDFTGVDPK